MYGPDLYLESPWVNAAGTLGYLPPPRWPVPESMGAFVTNPVSLAPRTPAGERGVYSYPGGALLHSGMPNPGLSRVLRTYADRWAQSALPIWVHIFGADPDEIHQMVRRLEGRDGVTAVELGLPPNIPGEQMLDFVKAAYGELPLIVQIPITITGEPWLRELPRFGVSAISLGPPRGMLPNNSQKPVSGRLYGPALLPLTLAALQTTQRFGLPVIAGPGIYTQKDAHTVREAGAWAVQIDTILWRGWSASPVTVPE
jgi:dihydroorotate dehydrogenase (NAD+) catalytic subunit